MALLIPAYAVRDIDNGAALSPRTLAIINEAFKRAGIPLNKRWVSQGSWHQGALSGSTHLGGGAFDLRSYNLTALEVERLVHELRILCGGPVWLRNAAHGGFDPHIHGIVRDEPALSSGARWQVAEYDAGRDGLSQAGPDYHPRPAWRPFVASQFTRVTRFPRTGVYAGKSERSTRVAWKAFRPYPLSPNVEFVSTEKDSTGRLWLKTPAGNWILAKATAYKP